MKHSPDEPPEGSSQIVLYLAEDGRTRIQVRLEDNTVWLTQALIADLFEITPQNVTLHLRNLYEEGELEEEATCEEYLQVPHPTTARYHSPPRPLRARHPATLKNSLMVPHLSRCKPQGSSLFSSPPHHLTPHAWPTIRLY